MLSETVRSQIGCLPSDSKGSEPYRYPFQVRPRVLSTLTPVTEVLKTTDSPEDRRTQSTSVTNILLYPGESPRLPVPTESRHGNRTSTTAETTSEAFTARLWDYRDPRDLVDIPLFSPRLLVPTVPRVE